MLYKFLGGISISEKIKKVTFRLTEKDFLELKKKIEFSNLNQQTYLYYAVMSKPIKKIDFKHLNRLSDEISKIENLLRKYAEKIDVDDTHLVKLFYFANKRLDDIWLMLKEFL